MNKNYFLLSILCLSLTFNLRAHSPPAPDQAAASCNGTFGNFCNANGRRVNVMNHGFGHFTNPDDNSSLNKFEIGCSPDLRRSYVKNYCGVSGEPDIAIDSTQVMMNLVRPMFLEKVRKTHYQKFLFEAQSLGRSLPEPPTCLGPDGEKMKQDMIRLQEGEKKFSIPSDLRRLKERLDVVTDRQQMPTLIRAIYQHDRTAKALSKCKKPYRTQECLDIFHVNERIKMNNPALYAAPVHTGRSRDLDPAKVIRERFRSQLWLTIGAALKPNAKKQEQRKAGEEFYQKNMNMDEIDAGIAFDGMLAKVQDELSNKSNKVIKEVENDMIGTAKAMHLEQYDRARMRFFPCKYDRNDADNCTIENRAEKLCDDSIIFGAMGNDPNVIRQALTDMTPQERDGAKLLVCRWDVLKEYRKTRCHGVTTLKTKPTQVKVRLEDNKYPYTATTAFDVIEGDPDSGFPHKVKAKFYFKNNSKKNSAEFKQLLAAKALEINRRFNQAGEKHGAEFDIELVATTDDNASPLVTINECFNANIDSSSCSEIEKFHRGNCAEECLRNKKTEPACSDQCVQTIKSSPRSFNRENAANLTAATNDGVFTHEVGHLMGLDDEYQDPGVRYTDMAHSNNPTSSVMKDSDGGVLLDRHINQILMPLECSEQD